MTGMRGEREYGVVKVFDVLKGYGFIRREKGRDLFVFYSDVDSDDRLLAEGDTVSFMVEKQPKGPRAKAVRKEG